MNLTDRLLQAIEEALNFRLAGVIEQFEEDDAPTIDDYQKALDWVWAEKDKRFDRKLLKQAKKGTAKP